MSVVSLLLLIVDAIASVVNVRVHLNTTRVLATSLPSVFSYIDMLRMSGYTCYGGTNPFTPHVANRQLPHSTVPT